VGKYVALNLSDCAATTNVVDTLNNDKTFDPDNTISAGKDRIVSLTLPDATTGIKTGGLFSPAFQHFTALASVTGVSVREVGDYAFFDRATLSSVSFLAVETIGDFAFAFCTVLNSISLPVVTTIGNGAFQGCAALSSFSIPASLTNLTSSAFILCAALTDITIAGANPNYSQSADKKMILDKTGTTLIAYPSASGAVTLTGITSIGPNAFSYCVALTSVNLPAATSIGDGAFKECAALTSVDLPAATSFGSNTFEVLLATGSEALTITLGNTVPTTLGNYMFSASATPKTVIVKVPAGATAWGGIIGSSPYTGADITDNWGNGFRGGGWNGSTMRGGQVNLYQYITLEIEPYTP
jgi:hypothetical protein